MKDSIRFYKIRDINTGLFSNGGLVPSFSKKGKTWNNIGHVKASLVGYSKHTAFVPGKGKVAQNTIPRTWEVVEYIFTQTEKKIIPIEEVVIAAGLF